MDRDNNVSTIERSSRPAYALGQKHENDSSVPSSLHRSTLAPRL